MTEINNNIPNFGIKNIDKVEKTGKASPAEEVAVEKEEQQKYVPDTGVLGRSQVKALKGGNISQSVDLAVEMAKNKPVLMQSGESLFNSIYNDLVERGMEPSEAYMNALMAEDEFYALAASYNR